MKRIDFRDLQKYLHEIPNQFHSDELLKKIHSMDAHTAYALLGGYLAPLLHTPTKVTTAPKPLHLETIARPDVAEVAHADLRNLNKSKLPQIEELMEELKEKFRKFINIFPKSVTEIDPDGHSDLRGYDRVIDVYEDIDSLTNQIRNLIGDSTIEWREHPELRRKYSEILTVITAIIPPYNNRYVLPLKHARIVFQDLKKALKELYESRSELEKRALKDLQERLDKLTKEKNKEIGVLEKEVDDLTSKETSNKNKIAELDKKIKDLESGNESKLLEKDREISKLKKEISDLEVNKKANITTIKQLREDLKKLNKEVTDLKAKEAENKSTIATLTKQVNDLTRDKNENEEKIAKLDKKIKDLTRDKTVNEEKIAKLDKQIKDLTRDKNENEEKIADLTKQVNDLTRDKTGNEGTIDDLTKQVNDLTRDKNENEEKIADLTKQVNDLTRDKTGNEKTIDDLNKEIEGLNNKITTLEGKKDEDKATITKLKEDITRLEREKSERDTKIKSLEKDLQEAKNDLITVTAAKDAAIDSLKKQIEEKDEEIGNLQQEINGLKQKIKNQEELDKRINDLLKEKEELTKEKEELEKTKGREIGKLQKDLADLDKRIRELEALKEAEITALQKDLEKVREDLKIKEKEIKDTKIDEMGKELPDLQKLIKDLEDGGIDLKDLSKLRDKLDNLNRLTKDGKDAVDNLEDLQKNINELREELKKQKLIELEKQKRDKEISDRENKLDDLQLEILKLRRELNDLESLKGKDLTDLRKKLEKLENLKKEVGDSNKKVKNLEEEVNKLRRELNKNKQDELDRQKEISDREKEIERKKKEEEINKIKEIELEELKKKQGMMDAYVFMIVVFLTQLHTRQAEKLKTHGETLQKISRIFDQWNVIQRGLNTISQNATTILRWIKERKVDSNYNLYTDSSLSKKETDSSKLAIWNTFKSFLPNLQKNVKELRRILDEVRPDLPNSAKTLLDTMYKLSRKLLDIPDVKGDNDLTSYLKVTTQSEGEIRVSKEIEDLKTENKKLMKDADDLTDKMSTIRDEVGEFRWNLSDWFLKVSAPDSYKLKQEWNQKHNERSRIYTKIEAKKKEIQEKENELRQQVRKKIALPDKRLTILQWISDSDQTEFKAYMDNLAQGVTALTSISNMAQQELQIDTQYYNSLLGLQKAGMDSLTRTVQGVIANMK